MNVNDKVWVRNTHKEPFLFFVGQIGVVSGVGGDIVAVTFSNGEVLLAHQRNFWRIPGPKETQGICSQGHELRAAMDTLRSQIHNYNGHAREAAVTELIRILQPILKELLK